MGIHFISLVLFRFFGSQLVFITSLCRLHFAKWINHCMVWFFSFMILVTYIRWMKIDYSLSSVHTLCFFSSSSSLFYPHWMDSNVKKRDAIKTLFTYFNKYFACFFFFWLFLKTIKLKHVILRLVLEKKERNTRKYLERR